MKHDGCSKELRDFVTTFESLLFNSQKEIKNLYDNEYHDNPSNVEETYETEDIIYKMRVSMVSKDKTYCKDCSYYIDECKIGEQAILDKKKYCEYFTTEKRCWDCTHQETYGGDDYFCELKLFDYHYDCNESKECPKWECDLI